MLNELDLLREMNAKKGGQLVIRRYLPVTPEQDRRLALMKELVFKGYAKWVNRESRIAEITEKGQALLLEATEPQAPTNADQC